MDGVIIIEEGVAFIDYIIEYLLYCYYFDNGKFISKYNSVSDIMDDIKGNISEEYKKLTGNELDISLYKNILIKLYYDAIREVIYKEMEDTYSRITSNCSIEAVEDHIVNHISNLNDIHKHKTYIEELNTILDNL